MAKAKIEDLKKDKLITFRMNSLVHKTLQVMGISYSKLFNTALTKVVGRDQINDIYENNPKHRKKASND